jgi:hypothetical protein
MNKALMENGWQSVVRKYKIKDNGLQRALGTYEDADEDDHAEQLKGIAKINQLAVALQRDRDIAGNKDVMDYLDDIQDAADAEQKEISKAKVTAARAEAAAEKQEKEEDVYKVKLLAALQKVRGSNGASFEFMVCDGPEQCAVIVAPAITTQHKQQLTRLTDGGKRFSKIGSCRFENGKFAFALERPPSGLARKLQASIAHFTGRKIPIIAGPEVADSEEES